MTQVHQGSRVTDVVVILDAANRREPEDIGLLMLRNADGLTLPLKQLADELKRYLEGRPILSRPISRPERAVRWCRPGGSRR